MCARPAASTASDTSSYSPEATSTGNRQAPTGGVKKGLGVVDGVVGGDKVGAGESPGALGEAVGLALGDGPGDVMGDWEVVGDTTGDGEVAGTSGRLLSA
jgi:hypothetical protein